MKNPSGWIICVVLTLPWGAVAGKGPGQPRIDSLDGTPEEGRLVVIRGAGFGEGPEVVMYDDFERGSDGAKIPLRNDSLAVVGRWTDVGAGGCKSDTPPTYSSQNARGGSLAYRFDASGSCWSNGLVTPVSSNEIFFSYHIFIPTGTCFPVPGGCGGQNWKNNWLYGPGRATNRGDRYPFASEGRTKMRFGSNASQGSHYLRGFQWGNLGQHMFWEFYLRPDSSSGMGDVKMTAIDGRSGATYRTFLDKHGVDVQATGPWSGQYHFLDVGGYGKSNNLGAFYDNVYVAQGPNAQARVVIADSDDLGGALGGGSSKVTAITHCTTFDSGSGESWDAEQITCTVRAHNGLTNGQNVWFYVVDGQGRPSEADGPHEWSSDRVTQCSDGDDNDDDGKIDCVPGSEDEGCGDPCSSSGVDERHCGDGRVDTNEVCDGSALGGEDCRSQGYQGGELSCAPDCRTLDSSRCTIPEPPITVSNATVPKEVKAPGTSRKFSHDQRSDFLVVTTTAAAGKPRVCRVAGVTFGGTEMTRDAEQQNRAVNGFASIWHLAEPQTGTHEVVISYEGECAGRVTGSALSLDGVESSSAAAGGGRMVHDDKPPPELAIEVDGIRARDWCLGTVATNGWSTPSWGERIGKTLVYGGNGTDQQGAAASYRTSTRDRVNMTYQPAQNRGDWAVGVAACYRPVADKDSGEHPDRADSEANPADDPLD